MQKYIYWDVKDLVKISKERIANDFDCIIALTGDRGSGKSTIAYKSSLMLGFNPNKDLIYSREELLEALRDYERVINADEIINAAYKREFYNVDQIELIKLLNMYRDHRHVLFLCIPNFWDLDRPLRDLVKIRIDIIRRGLGVVHQPLQLAYTNDPWDQKVNQVIERKWMQHGGQFKPKYWKLTTFAGFFKYGKLRPDQEVKYKRLKEEKRILLQRSKDEKSGKVKVEITRDYKDSIYSTIYHRVKEGLVSRDDLITMSANLGIPYKSMVGAINDRLKNEGIAETSKHFLQVSAKDAQTFKQRLKVSAISTEGLSVNNTTSTQDDGLGYDLEGVSSN